MQRLYRLILPTWAKEEYPSRPPVLEGEFSDDAIETYNAQGYNIYSLPNRPSIYTGGTVKGSQVDQFNYVFVDFDLKSGTHPSKEAFLATLADFPLYPSKIVDSGGGIHLYWKVSDLDAKSYLQLSRRLMRRLNTDEAVGQIFQLMRVEDTVNTKFKDDFRLCEVLDQTDQTYTCEDLDAVLPRLSFEDEKHCQQHYDKTYSIDRKDSAVDDKIPLKFAQLLSANHEVAEIWRGGLDDRSKGDFRLGHIMFASGLTKKEAISVLVNSPKALGRSPQHRVGYAENIVDKIWTVEEIVAPNRTSLSRSVFDIIATADQDNKGKAFRCNTLVDGTYAGFKRGEVLGLVGGAGVGKTTFALNMFRWFVEAHPESVHFFVSLEQSDKEIAKRWVKMCRDQTQLHKKVEVLGNYNPDGSYRNLSLPEIKAYILKFMEETGQKVGCVVLDHVGILKRDDKHGETQGLAQIFKDLKSFAVETDTFFVIQSQTNRSKAGIGDLELDKDAAYGSTAFEWYVDYMVTIWAPLKRIYSIAPNMTVTAFKYCKIREKNVKLDKIQEDQRYKLMYDVDTERYRLLTQDEEKSFVFFNEQATNLRKKDKKVDVSEYISSDWTQGDTNGAAKDSKNNSRTSGAT